MTDTERERMQDHDVFYDGPEPLDPHTPDGGTTADALVAALLEAGPEAAEHLLKAAQELLLAAKSVVDAGERVLEQHRAAPQAAGPPTPERRVRRIDLA